MSYIYNYHIIYIYITSKDIKDQILQNSPNSPMISQESGVVLHWAPPARSLGPMQAAWYRPVFASQTHAVCFLRTVLDKCFTSTLIR